VSVTESNAIRDELADLRDNLCLKWREIAKRQKFKGIPIQTLSMIYLGKRGVPKRYREQLGIPDTAPAPVCPSCNVVHVGKCPKHSKGLSYTRTRRTRLNGIAKEAGHKSWSAYETAMLREHERLMEELRQPARAEME